LEELLQDNQSLHQGVCVVASDETVAELLDFIAMPEGKTSITVAFFTPPVVFAFLLA